MPCARSGTRFHPVFVPLVAIWACGEAGDPPENVGGTGLDGDLPPLVVNEFMASNESTVLDEAGDSADWIEVHNLGGSEVDLSGFHLSDDLDEPTKWAFPDGTVLAPGGFLLVWADDDTGDGPLHAPYKLDADGEEIGLFGRAEDGAPAIDTLVFEPQATDVSMARMPDGSGTWVADTSPTPGASNG
ncbi:lamin tail domain-containing protein [Myxococcota bacterium]|nr:lamin tail domain-containing protein [Myxococcota bacterium]